MLDFGSYQTWCLQRLQLRFSFAFGDVVRCVLDPHAQPQMLAHAFRGRGHELIETDRFHLGHAPVISRRIRSTWRPGPRSCGRQTV